MACLVKAFVAALVFAAVPASAEAATDGSMKRTIDRGNTMYQYDRAAWLTSDDILARLPLDRQPEVGGWIVTATANGLHVDYFGKDAAAERVVYSADIVRGAVTHAAVYPATAAPVLTEPALQMARALRAAWNEMNRQTDWQPCAPARFNTIVLPPEANGTVPVYFLTPQTETNSFPFGGHYEIDIASDGKTANKRAFTRGCLTMAKQPPGKGSAPAALFVTHLMDPHPTEIHLFEQHYLGVPVFVGTGPKSLWKVESGTIEDVSATMAQ